MAELVLSDADIASWAERLDASEQSGQQIGQISAAHPGMGFADAYAVQKAWVAKKLARGRVLKGHKIGLTSKAMQRFSNINEPDYGALLDDMFFHDGCIEEDGVPAEVLKQPKSARLGSFLRSVR